MTRGTRIKYPGLARCGIVAAVVCVLAPLWTIWGISVRNSGDVFVLALPVMISLATLGLAWLALGEVRRG